MSVYDWIKQRDRNAADASTGTEAYFSLSPTRWSLYRVLREILPQTLHGRCLDAGAGRMAFALMARDSVEQYIAFDVQARPGLDAAGSILDLPLRNECLDSILCLQVLEHVSDPERALREFYRCLKPDGVLLLSVPHLAYLHNEPHDYFRFTHHGLRVILSRAGFQDIEIVPAGGLLSFLGHIPSLVIKAVFAPVPVLNHLAFAFNAAYSKTLSALDARIEKRKIFALNYIARARKK